MPRTSGVDELAKIKARNSVGYMFGQYRASRDPRQQSSTACT